MARKNRIVVENGLYHITTRIANGAFLLKDGEVKAYILKQMFDIADFAGIEICAWNIMDNHLHIFLRVPTVPEKYWSDLGTLPQTAWRSMRPAECRSPRWTPKVTDPPCPITPCGDSPSAEAIAKALADGVPVATIPHHEVGFGMSDGELMSRLRMLYAYNPDKVLEIESRWVRLRRQGLDDLVEKEKAKYFRRMYSISAYLHTLKQRISEYFNRALGHEGQLWGGRFYSTLVEDTAAAKLFVSSYIEWNAPRAIKEISHPREWEWCSYAVACGDCPRAFLGRYGNTTLAKRLVDRVRNGYERQFGCPWEEAKARLDAVFADGLPENWDDACVNEVLRGELHLRMAQLIKAVSLSRLAFFSNREEFVKETYLKIGPKFPGQGYKSVRFLAKFEWPDSPRIAA